MKFSKTIGHEKQKQLFLRAVAAGRLGHAYAFVGPENIGKTTFALDLAQVLGAHPVFDIYLYDSEEGLSIEEGRALQTRLSLTPTKNFKVAIVSHAESMTLEAANSLLKVLEEPPEHSLLILITSNFYALLPTIASRVQRLNFTYVPEAQAQEGLREFALEPQRAFEIVDLSSGRIGLARRLATDPKLLEFYAGAKKNYQILREGSLLERLQTAEKLAGRQTNEQSEFLKFAMQNWVLEEGQEPLIARKLQQAQEDLKFNLNVKLVFDNLFLL